MKRHETEEIIDVSQDAQTPDSSTEAAKGPVVSNTYDERIEDSNKDTAKSPMAAATQSLQPDDDDELYGLSPKGKAALELAKVSAKKPAVQDDALVTHQDVPLEKTDKPAVTEAAVSAKAPRTVIDDLLSQGAIARPSQVEKHRSKGKAREKADKGM